MNIGSRRRARLLSTLMALTSAATVPAALAQGTALVPTSDIAYRELDRLSELGFLDSAMIGQRPHSRREIARILGAARGRSDRLGEQIVSHRARDRELSLGDDILERLERRFLPGSDQHFDDPIVSLLDGISLVYTATDAERRSFPATHTRPINATIGPLVPRRLGTPVPAGHTAALELAHRLEPLPWLALNIRERFEARAPRDTMLRKQRAELLIAAVRMRAGNVALSVGREPLAWAQAGDAGLLFAAQGPALDRVTLASDRPFALPGFLRALGPTQGTLVVADLGPSTVRSRSKLLAYKVSVRPSSGSEFGASFMNHFGGAGGRSSSATDRLIDFLPFVDVFRKHNYTDSSRALDVDSDKILGVDGRLRLGGRSGVLLTGELIIDDFDVGRIPKLLTGYGSQTLGITVPRLGSPRVSMELTAKHMGIIAYSHAALTNGIASRGSLLGDELGPDAKAFGAELRWQPYPGVLLTASQRHAIYSNAEYRTFYAGTGNQNFVVEKVSRTAAEVRDRTLGTLSIQTEAGPVLVARAGGERVRNYNFQGGRRLDYVVELGLHLQR